jgi:pyruvate dehydrogenase (quinone)
VTLDAYMEAEHSALVIEDSGPGIPAKERERVRPLLPAARHEAVVELAEGEHGRGLRVTVRFAPARLAAEPSQEAGTLTSVPPAGTQCLSPLSPALQRNSSKEKHMASTVADFLLKRLSEWGVRRVYGYPGDGINGIMGAFGRNAAVEFIQARHEELAAFMACAHAKFSGEIGVCLATSGPGAIHLLNGLYDAMADHQPVLAIVGQQKRAALGGDYQQEVDLISLFKDVAREYVHMATTPEQVRHLVDRGVRIALEHRTVTCLIFPNDLQDMEAVETPPREHGTIHSGIGVAGHSLVPEALDLEHAAEILNSGEKVAILAGAGALHATDELIETADRLGAGIAKALLGKAAVPDDLPFVTGSIGLLGTKPSWDMMEECDTLLMVGSGFPYSEFLPKEGQARGVQIDIDGRMLSLRYPMELNLVGDSRRTLQALIPLLERKTDRRWREKLEREVARWWRVLEKRAMNQAHPINPQRVFWELSQRLPDDCILTSDSCSAANWYARDLKIRRGMMGSLSGGLATMGPGVPYAIAAKFAHPHRPVIAMVGDGAMQMNGISGLITLSKYWKKWSDPRLVVMVLNNGDLNQVTWEQRAMEGDPRFAGSQDVPEFPYARYAELLGLGGIRVDRPEGIGEAWDRALAADRPTVLEMVTDPSVPPLPPHITMEQAKAYLSALIERDADSIAIVKASAKEVWASLVPAEA